MVHQVFDATGLGIKFITATTRQMPELDMERINTPILPIDRRLAPPWKHN